MCRLSDVICGTWCVINAGTHVIIDNAVIVEILDLVHGVDKMVSQIA